MKLLLWNVLLGITWTAATGTFTAANLLVGLVLGYAMLWFTRGSLEPTQYFRKVPQALGFAAFYLRQMVLANLRVAYDVLTPTHLMRPGVLAIPLDDETDLEITVLSNLITLTPGSLAVDVSRDRRTLYVHVMYLDKDNPETTRREIGDDLRRRVLELMR